MLQWQHIEKKQVSKHPLKELSTRETEKVQKMAVTMALVSEIGWDTVDGTWPSSSPATSGRRYDSMKVLIPFSRLYTAILCCSRKLHCWKSDAAGDLSTHFSAADYRAEKPLSVSFMRCLLSSWKYTHMYSNPADYEQVYQTSTRPES